MQRREFVAFCAAAAATRAIADDAQPRWYSRARLVDAGGTPFLGKTVPVNRNLIFHYPYAATPCFLLNLDRPAATSAHLKTADAKAYEWRGGVGENHSIVAYSAICAHKLTYPTRHITFISFRHEKRAPNPSASPI